MVVAQMLDTFKHTCLQDLLIKRRGCIECGAVVDRLSTATRLALLSLGGESDARHFPGAGMARFHPQFESTVYA